MAHATLAASLSKRSEQKSAKGKSRKKFFGGPFFGPSLHPASGPFPHPAWALGGFPHPALALGGLPHPGLVGNGAFLKDAHKNNLAAQSEVKATEGESKEKFFGGSFHPALAYSGFPHPAMAFDGFPHPALALGGFPHPGLGYGAFLKDAHNSKDAKWWMNNCASLIRTKPVFLYVF